MRAMFHYLLACLFLLSFAAQAQLSDSITDFTTENGARGAVTNRRVADQLYQSALADEQRGIQTKNIGLLAKAFTTVKDAKAADDQAKEFARAAMHGINSGTQSGDFNAKTLGITDENQLRDIANNDSPYQAQAEARLKNYPGLALTPDKTKLKTPLGAYSYMIDNETMNTVGRAIAKLLGHDADAVTAGIKASERERDAIVARTQAEVDAQIAAAKAAHGMGTGAQAATGEIQVPGLSEEGGRDPTTATNSAAAQEGDASLSPNEDDIDAKQRAILAHQDAIRRQMGMQTASTGGSKEPIGTPDQNLFEMIHLKYQSIDRTGVFLAE